MKYNSAFSLLELSIVLVIIGLIAGGIVAGASMIRAAELRAVITEQQQFNTAVYTFRDKYLGLPGDLKNAESFWGTMSTGTCPNATAGIGTETCNGNGNGEVTQTGVASQSNEYFTFWQQLSNADLISGSFTGVAGTVGPLDHALGENAPASKLSGAGWGVKLVLSGETNWFDGISGNTFRLGARATGDGELKSAILTSTEIWGIDKKIDDGKPATGNVVTLHISPCNDASTSADLDSVYVLNEDDVKCAVIFDNAF